ncbi:MAG TPA: hypothetical protein VGP07_12815 [Polyangia bacterium]|jgi:hypothetical protein
MGTTGTGQVPVPAVRPGWLTFFAVTAIVLGALIAMTAVSELVGARLMAAQRGFLRDLSPAGETNHVRELQLELQTQIAEITGRDRPFLLKLAPFGFLAALGMILGGIGCLSLRGRARLILLSAFALGAGYEVARAKPTLERQLAIANLTQSSITKMMDAAMVRQAARGPSNEPSNAAPPALPPRFQQVMATTASFTALASISFAVGLVVLQFAFLLSGVVYLTRPRVRALFH